MSTREEAAKLLCDALDDSSFPEPEWALEVVDFLRESGLLNDQLEQVGWGLNIGPALDDQLGATHFGWLVTDELERPNERREPVFRKVVDVPEEPPK